MTFPRQRHPAFLNQPGGAYADGTREYSEATAQALDAETKKILDARLDHVVHLLKDKRHLLDRISTLLLEKEVIEAEEFAQIVEDKTQVVI